MKKYFTNTLAVCCAIVFGVFLTSETKAQCLNTFEFLSVDASLLDNSVDTISSCSFFGDYTPVTNITAGSNFRFALPNNGFITVREGTFDGPVVVQGFNSVNVFNASGLDLFLHFNEDAFCTESTICQVSTVQCLTCDGCLSLSQFADNDISTADNTVVTQSGCNFVNEYNEVTGIPFFETIEFTATAGAYIVVRGGTFDGPIVGEGFSPVQVSSGFGANLYPHYFSDATCGVSALGCIITTVQCTTCPFPDPMDGNCYNDFSFGGADLSAGTNESTFLSSCAFSTEYSEVTGVPAGENIQFTLAEPGYITVREGTPNGTVVAQGFSPVTVAGFAVTGANLYAHWTSDEFCTQGSECFDATVQCTTCPTCPDGSNPGDACDDGNPATTGTTVQEDCSCGGGGLIPANDTCEGVSGLLDCGESISGSTDFALPATNTPSGCGFILSSTNDVWYAFQANGDDNYIVTVDGGLFFDGVVYVYEGLCGTQTEIGCSDLIGNGVTETVELNGLSAGTYYIQLYDYFGTGEYTVSLECESSCANPFPAVSEASLSTVFTGSAFATSWDAVPNQIGCQIQVRFAGGSILGARIVGGAAASGFNIPGNVLTAGTDYEWRVRCGCSQVPLVAGPFTSWQPFSTPGGSAISSLPNPTNGLSNVTFTVSDESYTTLEVFDMSGRLVDAIFTGNAQPNNDYRFEFDGSALPNGVYLYRLTTENEVINDKFMIAK